jgi:hypothetical protein
VIWSCFICRRNGFHIKVSIQHTVKLLNMGEVRCQKRVQKECAQSSFRQDSIWIRSRDIGPGCFLRRAQCCSIYLYCQSSSRGPRGGAVSKSRPGKSTLGTSTELGFWSYTRYIILKNLITGDILRGNPVQTLDVSPYY